jgi:hypothetical protein
MLCLILAKNPFFSSGSSTFSSGFFLSSSIFSDSSFNVFSISSDFNSSLEITSCSFVVASSFLISSLDISFSSISCCDGSSLCSFIS